MYSDPVQMVSAVACKLAKGVVTTSIQRGDSKTRIADDHGKWASGHNVHTAEKDSCCKRC